MMIDGRYPDVGWETGVFVLTTLPQPVPCMTFVFTSKERVSCPPDDEKGVRKSSVSLRLVNILYGRKCQGSC